MSKRLNLMQLAAHAIERGRPQMWRLDAATTVIEQAELLRVELVASARADGISWTEIGQHLGMTKQAAQQRYGKKPATPRLDPAQLSIDDA